MTSERMPFQTDPNDGPCPISAELSLGDACRLTEAEWNAVNGHLHLTAREMDIARQLLLGHSETSIAVQLGISANTVHTHLGRVYKKVNVRSAAGFIRRVFALYVEWTRSK